MWTVLPFFSAYQIDDRVLIDSSTLGKIRASFADGTAEGGCPTQTLPPPTPPTALEFLSPASASHRKTSDTRQTAGSAPATCRPRDAYAASCHARARGSAGSRLPLTLPARCWDHNDTWIHCSAALFAAVADFAALSEAPVGGTPALH